MFFRVLALFLAVVYAYAAFVQINDPDPLIWVSIYLVPTALCVAAAFDREDWRLTLAVAAMAGLGAVWVGSAGIEDSHPMKGFPQYGIFREEVVRESLGLALVAVGLLIVGVRGRMLSASGEPDP